MNFPESFRSEQCRSMYFLVDIVDLVKSFPTSSYLQKSASIQPRASLSKFGGESIHFSFTSLVSSRPQLGSISIFDTVTLAFRIPVYRYVIYTRYDKP